MLVAVETVAAAALKATMCGATSLEELRSLGSSRGSGSGFRGVGWSTWPCCQNPGRRQATSRRAVAREAQVLRRTGFDLRGQLSLFSSSPSVERTHQSSS